MLQRQLAATQLARTAAQNARAFAEFDIDANMQLDLDEFINMQPKAIRETFSIDQIEACFRLAGERWHRPRACAHRTRPHALSLLICI